MFVLAWLTQALLLICSATGDEEPIVETPLGKLRGHTLSSRSGRKYMAFSGVPYAKPPIGKLRFQAPEAVTPWEGIKDAKNDGPICLQYSETSLGQEDCLYLSVYTHNTTGISPVLVHIHGGAYSMGDESWYGSQYLMDEDIVVVQVNYRLGIFGFLTLESPELPGNQGVKDQLMALRWVQRNIASIGGNPNLVTIIGESAGGASVYNHIISPLSKGLFHRVISESGTSYAPWGVTPPGYRKSTTEKLLELLNCPTNAKEGIPCISAKDTQEIISKTAYFSQKRLNGPIPFGPVIEAPGTDSFIVGLPSTWSHSPVPLFIGTDSAEGLLVTKQWAISGFDYKSFSSNFNHLAPDFLGYSITASNPDKITKEIRNYYLKNEDITVDDYANITMVISDIAFTVPIVEGADRHTGSVYFYYFDFTIPDPAIDKRFAIGAKHTDEARYIWNMKPSVFYPPLVDPRQIELSKKMVKIVTSFMRTGVPIIEGDDTEWKTWTNNKHKYMHIDLEGFHLKEGLAEDRVKFWKSLDYMDKYGDKF